MSSSFLFFCFLLILALFLFRKPKKTIEPLIRKKPAAIKKVPLPKKNHPIRSQVQASSSSYQVEKKKKSPFLKKGWNTKSSLKQAYIVSEVLKKWDENERKF